MRPLKALEYDTPAEATKSQHDLIKSRFAGCVATRVDGKRFWIKVWDMRVAEKISEILNTRR